MNTEKTTNTKRNVTPSRAKQHSTKNKIPQTTGGEKLPKYDPQSETTIASDWEPYPANKEMENIDCTP